MDPLTVSALIMGGTEIARGIGKGIKAGKQRKEYDEFESSIPLQDPNMVSYLGDTRRRRKMFDAGTDPFTAYTQGQIMNTGAQTQANAVRSGRGNLSDLMRIQSGTNNALAQSGAYASRNAQQLFGLEGDLVGAMADRAYNRQLSKANLKWSEYARSREDSNRALQAGIGMALSPLTYGAAAPKGVNVAGSSASPSLSDILMGVNNVASTAKSIDNTGTSQYGQLPLDQAGQNPWWQ